MCVGNIKLSATGFHSFVNMYHQKTARLRVHTFQEISQRNTFSPFGVGLRSSLSKEDTALLHLPPP